VAVLVDPDAVTDRTAASMSRVSAVAVDDMRGSKSRSTYGVGKALLEGQRDFDVVDVAGDWAGYRCVIAAENQRIDRAVAERLRDYVAAGGALVLVGPQMWLDPDARSLLEDLAGASYSGPGAFSSCFLAQADEGFAHHVSGPFARLTPRPGCETTAAVVLPLDGLDSPPVFSGHHAPPGAPDGTAGIARSGRVATIAASLASDYWQSGNPELRRLLLETLDLVLPERYVEVEPHTPLIEVSLMECDGEWIVHLLQQTVNRGTGPVLIEDVPVRRDLTVTVRPPYPVASVVRLPSAEAVATTPIPGGVRVHLSELGFHEMLCVEAQSA
jgi:hypothetical protein